MLKILRDKDIVQDIIHLIGYLALLGTVVSLVLPVVKGSDVWYRIIFFISLIVLILFILTFAMHTFTAVMRIYEPGFTISSFDKNHDEVKREIKKFLLLLLFLFLVTLVFIMCLEVVKISIGIYQV
jgi:glucan phosphoethanolaminetransferase (alkaline phosphatase superfamily)